MSLQIINNAIKAMCEEVESQPKPEKKWEQMTELQLLYEVVVCIASSQMLYEMAVAIADHLNACQLLKPNDGSYCQFKHANNIVQCLSKPIMQRDQDGCSRMVKPRFKLRLASMISSTVAKIYAEGLTLQKILMQTKSARSARQILVAKICGFGPKQASLFLRRIGYCSELAVLDVHILDYLELAKGQSVKARTLSRLSVYEQVEDELTALVSKFGHSMGCVDLAMWVTMRVAKQEAYI